MVLQTEFWFGQTLSGIFLSSHFRDFCPRNRPSIFAFGFHDLCLWWKRGQRRGSGVTGLARGVRDTGRSLVFLSELPKTSRKKNLHFKSEQVSSVQVCLGLSVDVHQEVSSQNLCGFHVFPLSIKKIYDWKTKGSGSMGSSQDGQQLSGSWWQAWRFCLLLLHVAVPLFWELRQFFWQKCKCVPLRARKLIWGENPTNAWVCWGGEPKLRGISSLVWAEASGVFSKTPSRAWSHFLLVSDISRYLPAVSFILFPCSRKLFLCFGVFFLRKALGRARYRCPSVTGGFRAWRAFPLLLPWQRINSFLLVQGRFGNSF